jgi:NAD(P)-dependent dehydrogenase (short-subunit alcohol dehydrogenase family)
MKPYPLKGRTALITGASKGLGRAMACALAEAGADMVLVSRNLEQLEETAGMTRSLGAKTFVYKADVTDEAQIEQLGKAVLSDTGGPHILINNAGINVRKPITDFTTAEWRSVLDTNLTGVFFLCRCFVPQMKGRGYGRIINMTSTLSHVAIPGRGAYCASKAGLLGLTRALALELAPEKITVNGISPGPFATEMNIPLTQNPEINRQFMAKTPLARWGDPKDIGHMALFLCSDDAGFITGTDILLDGGWTAQ